MGQVWSPTSSSQFSLFYVFYFIFILLLWYHNDHHHHHPPHPHPDQNANQNDENLPIRAILVGKTFSTPGSIFAPVSSSEQICTLWKSFLEIYIGEHPLPMWQAVWYTGLHLPGRVYGLRLLPNKVRISPGWLLYINACSFWAQWSECWAPATGGKDEEEVGASSLARSSSEPTTVSVWPALLLSHINHCLGC